MAMSQFEAFVNDCKNHSNLKHVLDNLSSFDPALLKIYKDKGITLNDDKLGRHVLETGVALFAYLADVLVSKGTEGIPFWQVVTHGYPQHEHTDLFVPFCDVTNTQTLWVNTANNQKGYSVEVRAEITFNLIFRYHIASLELMRKVLVFSDYCRRHVDGSYSSNTLRNYLHGIKDPCDSLMNSAPSGRGEKACRYYDRTVRHSLSHGNVLISMPDHIILRLSAPNRENFIQREYSFKDKESMAQLQSDLLGSAEPCYQSVRVFFLLYSHLQAKHKVVLERHWRKEVSDGFKNTIDSINAKRNASKP